MHISLISVNGITALHRAAEYGDIEKLEDIIKTNINIDIQSSRGKTPLYFAAAYGNDEAVECLIRYGCGC